MAKALEDRVIENAGERPVAGDDIVFVPTDRRVRVMLGGVTIADSRAVMLMLEKRRLAVYYFPAKDVKLDLLQPTSYTSPHAGKGLASFYSVKVGDRVVEKAAWRYLQPERPDLKDYVAFYWDKMDAWFEEDDEVFVHPRDPYHRVDVLNSSRHVKVIVGGEVVAETTRPRLLFETGLPTRYYIPKVDTRLDLLTPTNTSTRCPYKGKASYWTVNVAGKEFTDIVWSYPAPIPECPKIENLLCFYDEKVDAVYVDGELQPKPKTPWS
jgi:uncharacterized protein (DUF427 family)